MAEDNEYQSTKSFCKFQVEVNGKKHVDLTRALAQVNIHSDITECYSNLQLFWHIDNQLWIQENLYPQLEITLKVIYTEEDGTEMAEPIIFDLIILETNIALSPKTYNNISDHRESQKRLHCSTCICKEAYRIMSSAMNRLWDSDVSPWDAVNKLMEDAGITNKKVEDCNKNTNTIDQLLITPMSFWKALDYINDTYGIYGNECFKYCYYNGTFAMWDIVEHYNKNKCGEITLHKLPTFGPNCLFDPPNQKARKSAKDFVTYDGVETVYRINDSVIQNGFKQTYIYHPTYDIVHYVNKTIDECTKPQGLIDAKPDLKMNGNMKNRLVSDCSAPGMMKPDFWAKKEAPNPVTRRFSRQLMQLNLIKFTIIRQVKIHQLLRVGQVLNFTPYAEHEKYSGSNYKGAYLVTKSDVTLSRYRQGHLVDIVDATATIVAGRSNQSYN